MMKEKEKILVIDHEPNVIESFKFMLENEFTIEGTGSGEDGLAKIKKENYLLVFLNITLPGMDGLETLKKIKAYDPGMATLIITTAQTTKTAVQAMKLGAADYFTKPFDVEEIMLAINKVEETKKFQQQADYLHSPEFREALGYSQIIGNSAQMQEVLRIVKEMQTNDNTVLVQGGSGTGKELVAQNIHFKGSRQDGPFVAVNCAAIPRDQMESELFGHEKGKSGGSAAIQKGKFELAAGGTIYLDEISALTLDIQNKLLRVLQGNAIVRSGGVKVVPIHARVIASCSVDLRSAVDKGYFHRDLYYRINVVPVYLPPLVERKGDIPLLADFFIKLFNKKYLRTCKGLTPQAMTYLEHYSWPGNVRELKNTIERVMAVNSDDLINENLLPLEIVISFQDIIDKIGLDQEQAEVTLKDARKEFEKRMLIAFMKKFRGNQSKISRLLSVHRNTILNKVRDFELNPSSFRRKKK
jgi:DNA-binding NtrC family response regulator